jgi:hypothetical protein
MPTDAPCDRQGKTQPRRCPAAKKLPDNTGEASKGSVVSASNPPGASMKHRAYKPTPYLIMQICPIIPQDKPEIGVKMRCEYGKPAAWHT